MTKKRVQRFIIRYGIGLVAMYLIFALVAYVRLTTVNAINSEDKLPDFKLENQFGALKSFDDYKGKVLLVDFWFQGCQPCLEEMKFFPELLDKYDSKLAIMSISIDSKETTTALLQQKPKPWNFLQADNLDWTFYNDNMVQNSYVKALGITSYPTYLLFDEKGELISTPYSGIAGVENELSGLFSLEITHKTKHFKEVSYKLPFLVIPYTVLAFLVVIIQLLVYGVKKVMRQKKAKAINL